MEELKARAVQYVASMLVRESYEAAQRSKKLVELHHLLRVSRPDSASVMDEAAWIMVKLARMLDKGELNENL